MPALIMNTNGDWIPYEEFNRKEREENRATKKQQQDALKIAELLITLDELICPTKSNQ